MVRRNLGLPHRLISKNFNCVIWVQIDESQTYQTVDGFGYTLTGGSVEVINSLTAARKQELLQELFGSNANSISISYLRLSSHSLKLH